MSFVLVHTNRTLYTYQTKEALFEVQEKTNLKFVLQNRKASLLLKGQ